MLLVYNWMQVKLLKPWYTHKLPSNCHLSKWISSNTKCMILQTSQRKMHDSQNHAAHHDDQYNAGDNTSHIAGYGEQTEEGNQCWS